MTVLAVDPGGTTGWSLWDGLLVGHGQMEFEQFVRFVDGMFQRCQDEGPITEIVCERYVITPTTAKLSQQTTALEVIGHLKALRILHDIPFTLQNPADAKRFGTNDRLDQLGWLKRPLAANDHANDSIRHLLTYLVKTHQVDVTPGTRAGR